MLSFGVGEWIRTPTNSNRVKCEFVKREKVARPSVSTISKCVVFPFMNTIKNII
jgi:hypothetical protein